MTEPIVSLAYKSRSTAGAVDEAALDEILSTSQRRNVAGDLTGALLYGEAHFIQVLEGPEASLLATMHRIRTDDRHYDLQFVGPMPIIRRDFPDWCMAFLPLERGLEPTFKRLVAEWSVLGGQASRMLTEALKY